MLVSLLLLPPPIPWYPHFPSPTLGMFLASHLTSSTVWDAKPLDPNSPINWVELKTSATPHSDRDILKYERKLLKFWIQSFLLGVPKIIVGFRSPDGVLESLEEMETAQIPGMVKAKGKGSWDGNVCINFTARWLECEYDRFPSFFPSPSKVFVGRLVIWKQRAK